MSERKLANPFYALLIPMGIVFAITACAYAVMTVRGLDPHSADEGGLVGLMDRHGLVIMAGEIAILGVLTALAIGTDGFWTQRPVSDDASLAGRSSAERDSKTANVERS